MKIGIGLLLTFLSIQALEAQEEEPKGHQVLLKDWHREAKSAGLSLKAIQHLEKQKVLMTQDDLFQCFQAYLPQHERTTSDQSDLPYFITSDALFHAYSWCLQKSVEAMEQMHAEQTAEFLEVLMTSLDQVEALVEGDQAVILAAKERAQFVIGVAASLMELQTNLSGAVKEDVHHEVTRIRLALGSGRPARLKLPEAHFSELDYTIFKPASLYATDSLLAGYFRAVRWLQLVPFRLSSDEDMLAVVMLNLAQDWHRLKALKLNDKVSEYWGDREQRLESLAGPSSHLEVMGAIYLFEEDRGSRKPISEWIQEVRTHYGSTLTPWDEKRDQQTISTTLQQAMKDEVCAYMASASTLADAVLIEKLSRSKGPSYFPNALSVASWLGSGYAAELEKADAQGLEIRAETQKLMLSTDDDRVLHTASLRLLQRLFEPQPADAPAFLKSRAWQAKSCQTALAAWAQSRHVWALQATPQYLVAAGVQDWPAFIEPLPDFFTGLAGLCSVANLHFQINTNDYDPSRQVAKRLRKMADEYESPNKEDESVLERLHTTMAILIEAGVPHTNQDSFSSEAVRQYGGILRESADWIEKGEADSRHPIAQKLKTRLSAQRTAPFHNLEKVCLRLASLTHKQMRGLSPRAEEKEWLRFFGQVLARFTDSHFTAARDTVPKAVRMFTNPDLNKALTVGIGRPTFLYVLYPWKGKEILCRGAVLPYLERHEMETLTDEEWKQQLNSPLKAPKRPEWIAPLLAE